MESRQVRHASTAAAARFGELLRRYRLAAGLTLGALAQRTGLSRRAISALELGYRHAPRTRTVERLADALRLDPETHAALVAAGRGALILLPRARPGVVPLDATLPAEAPDTPEPPPHNLPLPPTPLLGREREVSELTALVREEGTRLITLTGPGGVGKTRLALEVAWALQHAGDIFPDGVWFVRLAPLTDPALVITTIAQALGLREAGGSSLTDLLHGLLRDQSPLLVLDNFEQVAAAAPRIAELLESSAGLRVLVTSRAPLRLRGERTYPVALLAVPPTGRGRVVAERLENYAATALFLQRARAARPDFVVTDATAPLIADICARLDGLPLGIELTAMWARLLSPAALLARLERRLPLLAGGPVDLPARHQTMRAAIAWSYDLLDAESQLLFGRLAVFADGWTVDAATVVCHSPPGVAPLRRDTLVGLGLLLDASLIAQRVSEDGETPRLEMLHVVREFALEQLEASGEAEALRRAHARYILAFAEEAEPALRGPDDITWMRLVERELGNVRAALEWARAAGEAEVGLRLATALWRFWSEKGYLSEGQQWIETLLALVSPEAADAAEASSESSAPRTLGPGIATWLRARALVTSGGLAATRWQVGPALTALEAGLSLARAADDWLAQVLGLLLVGAFADIQGEPRQAEACYEEALALGRAREDALAIVTALASLGGLACGEQRWAEATARFTDALNVARAAGRHQYVAALLVQLGEVALWQGEARRAAVLLGEALAAVRETNWAADWRRWDAISALDLLAVACKQLSQPERGARLLGAAAYLREMLRQPYVSAEQPRQEMLVAPVRAALTAEPWEAAFVAGKRLTLEEIFAEALVAASALAGGGPADDGAPAADRGAAPIRPARLTQREREVLRLLAEGGTDAHIAERLVLSPRTVNHHVAALYSKLGVTSRAAATRCALERGLL